MSSPSAIPPVARTRTHRGNRWVGRIIVSGLSLLALISMLVYTTFVLGLVQGEELSTETFERRTFTYYQLPVIELQVSGITRESSTGDLEKYLTDEKLISVTPLKKLPDDSLRWDLVHAHRFGVVFSRGEAEILCNYLDAVNPDGKHVWIEWSKQHPELAKIIWPAIVSVSQQELYIFVPELLELAGNATNPDDLQIAVDDLLAEQYVRVATTQQQLDRHELAVELYTNALDRSPRQITALEGRAVSLVALGSQEKADADLAQVRELKRY